LFSCPSPCVLLCNYNAPLLLEGQQENKARPSCIRTQLTDHTDYTDITDYIYWSRPSRNFMTELRAIKKTPDFSGASWTWEELIFQLIRSFTG